MVDRQVFDYCEEHGEYFQAYAGRCPKCLAKEDAAEVVGNHAEAIRAAIAPDASALHAIADRLREASGPDRELDAAIAVALQYDLPAPMGEAKARLSLKFHLSTDPLAPGCYWLHQFSGVSLRMAPEFTASLDACAALQAEAIPTWRTYANQQQFLDVGSKWIVGFDRIGPNGSQSFYVEHANRALAWLSAIVAAAIAEAKSG